jgi:acyl carrier protein phosphodiesterase
VKYDNKSITTDAQPVVTGAEEKTSSTKKVLPEIILKIYFIHVIAKSAPRRTRKNR